MSTTTHLSSRPAVTGERMLSPREAADYLGMRPQTLAAWRCTRRYPLPYIRVGACIRYRESDLRAFLDARTVSSIDIAE